MMNFPYSQILVPLDGTEAADRAIPVAARIAVRLGERVHLVAVCRPAVPPTAHLAPGFVVLPPEEPMRTHAALERHLEARADDVELLYHLPVTTRVIDGTDSVADELIGYSAEHAIDLVVMRTHGRSAMGRLCLGSVGDALVDRGSAPCLLLRDRHGAGAAASRRGWEFARILVPLDGSVEAEAGIEQALALAAPGSTDIRLLVVVPRQWVPEDRRPYSVPERAQFANAEAYANGMARRLEARGYRAKGFTVGHGSPAGAIAECVEAQGIDLVSIAAHHRGEANRFLFGSVIGTLVHEIDVPILAHRLGMASVRAEAPAELEPACDLALRETAAAL
jgi:nucleotide-binding universal stress UspA family protein